jgi:tetratricopeptide (TPR) repeat protein
VSPTFPPAEERPVAPVLAPRARRRQDAAAPGLQLRLAIAKAGLGIELAQPVRLGCLQIAELELAITTVRFPLDVSGGVGRFRHRRGELQRLFVEVGARDLERWAAPLLRGLLGPRSPEVWAAVRRAGATIAVVDDASGTATPRGATPGDPASVLRVLAFELTLSAEGDDLHLCVTRARGAGLVAPATQLAIRATSALLGARAGREGSHFVVRNATRTLARSVLPDAGVRAPSADGMRWTGLAAQGDHWIGIAAREGLPAETTEEAALALETCALTREADDARMAGDLERARRLDLDALERAPRHPEIARRIAEIDQLAGGRAEAALATLASAPSPVVLESPAFGALAGELHASVGDTQAAVAALVRVGETEPAAALAACAYERASELTHDAQDALSWLDLAIARAPRLAHLRWTRIARRLAVGRLEDALADAEHLEAQAQGGRARHAVWRRAGRAWMDAGLVALAAPLFERALRFEPEDPEAIAGLGASLVEAGRAARGAALLAHALEAAEARGKSLHHVAVDLARVLAHPLEDRPAAIARVRSVPNDVPEALVARALEGRWRAEIGDLAGASFAYARLRDLASSRVAGAADEAANAPVVELLLEAATFERDRREDMLAAQRLLTSALRLSPHHPAAQRAHVEVGLRIAGRPAPEAAPPDSDASPPDSQDDLEADDVPRSATFKTEPPKEGRFSFDLDPASPSTTASYAGEALDAARVDELSRLLQADPSQDAIVDELAQRLTRLGRTHELLALLSARLEEATPERRADLVPMQQAVLERLEQDARLAGRDLEAAFFRDAIKMLGSM